MQDPLTKSPDSNLEADPGYFLGISFLAFLVLVVSCLGVYMLLSWQRRRDQQQDSPHGEIEKKVPIDSVTDDEDEDVVVYDRQITNGDYEKKPALTWSGIRSKLSSHRTAPATEAEKTVLNQENDQEYISPVTLQQQETSIKSRGTIEPIDEEIVPIDIETINNDQTERNNEVYKETTVEINK